MAVQEKILKWVQGLDLWKQELFRRASATPELSDEDVQEVTSMLLGEEHDGEDPRAITPEDLPGARRGQERMAVHSVSELLNVNAIADGQALEFEPAGLSLVYGKNGAGKTGYSRILKHAGRTLYRETVLSNVTGDDGAGPSATIRVSVGEDVEDIPLDLDPGVAPPAQLGRICVADEQACEVYLTTETEVDYAPVMLTSLRRFRSGLERIDEELQRRRDEVRPGDLDSSPYEKGTEVRALLDDLPVATPGAVERLAALSEGELARREELHRKQGTIEAAQAPRLRAAADSDEAAARQLADGLDDVAVALGEEKIWEAKQRHAKIEELRETADLAAKEFEQEPLAGVGTDPWRQLWQAAKEYTAHLRQDLPADHVFEHCPLCMQVLDEDAGDRLRRFERFVRGKVNAQLEAAQVADKGARDALPNLEIVAATHRTAIERLGVGEGELGEEVTAWLADARTIVDRLRTGDFDELAGIRPAPGGVREWGEARGKEAAEYAALEKAGDGAGFLPELAELNARYSLHERRDAVLAHLTAEAQARRIDAGRKQLGKTEASIKMTQLSSEVVEGDLQDALNRQLNALGFQGLEVGAKPKTKKGTPKVELRLKTVDKAPLTAVLSKGEQRRLALAMFLAEMEVVADPSPVVLDDPVTSIDQEGRRNIARTLVALAEKRQVIVFTHEPSFVLELQRAAKLKPGIPLRVLHVRRIEATVGHVSDELPWEGLKAKQRTKHLLGKIEAASVLYEERDEDGYKQAASEYCMYLRGSFERAVEERVLGEVVMRRDDAVRTTALKDVLLNDEIRELVERGTDENSPWVHDRPIGDGADPPTPEELREGLKVYEYLLAAVKAFDIARKKAAEAKATS